MIRKKIGKTGEEYAAKLLLIKRYEIIKKNFYSRFGEVDIVAKKENTLIFVEVKTRTSEDFGTAEESVNKRKILKIIKTAFCFIEKSGQKNIADLRIDLIVVKLGRNLKLKGIKHIKNIKDG